MNKEFHMVKRFSKLRIEGRKNIIQLLEYDGTSLWWLIEPWMENPIRGVPKLSEAKGKNKRKTSLANQIYLNALKKSSAFKFMIRKIRVPSNKIKESDILIITHPASCQNGKNVRFGPIIEELRKNFSVSVVYFDDLASFGKITKKQVKKDQYSNSAEAFINKKVFNKISKETKKFKEIKKKLNQKIGKKLKLSEAILQRLNIVFDKHIPEAITYIEISKEIIKKIKPKIILGMSGLTLQGKASIVAAQSNNIPFIEIQEGLMKETLYYLKTKDDISQGAIMPDEILVYGFHEKKFLTEKCGFKKQKVKVVGQPASDKVFNIQKNLDRKKITEELGISEKKNLVFATSAYADKTNTINILKKLIQVAKKKDMQIIIKIHPRDHNKAEYVKTLKEKDIKESLVTKDADTYKILGITDIFVSAPSTIVLEAMMFKIPIVLLCLGKNNPAFQDYTTSNSTVAAKKISDIEKIIQKIDEPKCLSSLRKNMKKFLFEHAYRVDGKVSSRIARIVEKKIKGEKHDSNI